MMGQGMVAVGNTDLAVTARRSFAADQQCRNARQVSLERNDQHVGHQPEVIVELRWDAERLLHSGVDHHSFLLGTLHHLFYFADRRQVFVELAAIDRAEIRFQAVRIVGHQIENASPHGETLGVCRGRLHDICSEEALEQRSRIGDRRQRLRFRSPRHVVNVGARVIVIAVAGLPRFLKTYLYRRQFRQMSHRASRNLIRGDAELNIGASQAMNLHAGHVRRHCSSMIARANKKRTAPV